MKRVSIQYIIADNLECKGDPSMWRCRHRKTSYKASDNRVTSINSVIRKRVNFHERT